MLSEELANAVKRPNFVAQICHSFEGGNRQKFLQQGSPLVEEFVTDVVKTLGCSPALCASLAYALTQSQYRVYIHDSIRLLKKALPELVSSGTLQELTEETANGLIKLIFVSEVLYVPICFYESINLSCCRKITSGFVGS